MKRFIVLFCCLSLLFLSACKKEEPVISKTDPAPVFDTGEHVNIGSDTINGLEFILYSDKTAMLYRLNMEEHPFNYYTPLEIPEMIQDYKVTEIYKELFSSTSFIEIILPDTIQKIGDRAFRKSNITKITLPKSLKEFGTEVFDNCNKLEEATFLCDMEEIPVGTFCNCTSLNKIILPKNTVKIGDDAFYGCTSLESIDIPNTLKEIGSYTFADCSKLSLSFGKEVILGEGALKNTK